MSIACIRGPSRDKRSQEMGQKPTQKTPSNILQPTNSLSQSATDAFEGCPVLGLQWTRIPKRRTCEKHRRTKDARMR
ncbi:hypothetical protein AVEN_84031-1 [Araneus ventricosus]|uniref:Uncharacterized protein n=1 Tax=Araneus ventricosus TaxID=182803 RepID=A0A4Y2SXG2_ARAVE|nr:hypothetical protein AVEN_84031-1 [Araneus ventricosus]